MTAAGTGLDVRGPLAEAYAAVDWARSPLGPVASWTPTLRTTVDLILQTRFPATLLWGPEFVLVYNEAYVELIADKHPDALGRRAQDVFPEAWADIGPLMRRVSGGGEATWLEDIAVPLVRHGFLEECYFTYSYSPVRNAAGEVEGVLDIVAETTRTVIDRRRLQTLGRLRARLAELDRASDLGRIALPVLVEARADLPAVDIRLDHETTRAGHLRLPPVPPPGMGQLEVVEQTAGGTIAWLPIGTHVSDQPPALLVVALSEQLAPDEEYLGFLRLIAASLAQALDRVRAREAERALAESLQRSLLTEPVAPERLDLAVLYQPSLEVAQVGGDWYDSFVLPDGALTVVIGDVAGHDRVAAAGMAQVRNILRGVAATLGGAPASTLDGLDAALFDLGAEVFATAVIARVQEGDGGLALQWSNAGHPPPVHIDPQGRATLLERATDPALGLDRGIRRHDHDLVLEPGAALVLYTDGLVERRGVSLDDRLAWLLRLLDGRPVRNAGDVRDLLAEHLDDGVEDDVALLVLRAR